MDTIKQPAFQIIKSLSTRLSGKGLGKIPFVKDAYASITKHTITAKDKLIDLGRFKIKLDTSKRGLDGMAAALVNQHKYEPMTTMLFEKIVKQGDTVVDIGANIGYFSLLAKSLGAERVYAFEPEPFNARCLRKNIVLNDMDIAMFNVAVSDKSGEAQLYVSRKESGEHSLIHGRPEIKDTITVPTIRLDDLLWQGERIKLVKVDVEGNEWNVLTGALNTILLVDNLLIEFWAKGIEASGHEPKDFWKLLEGMFRYIYIVDEIRKEIVPGNYVDALYRCDQDDFSVNLLCSKSPVTL